MGLVVCESQYEDGFFDLPYDFVIEVQGGLHVRSASDLIKVTGRVGLFLNEEATPLIEVQTKVLTPEAKWSFVFLSHPSNDKPSSS